MLRPIATSLVLFFVSVAAMASSTSAQVSEGSVYGPLPVFEFHSDFWVNLHHTLYQEAKFRTSTTAQGSDRDKASSKNRPTLKSSNPKAPLTPAEQRAWDEALNYYSANYTDKDL